MLIEYGAEVQGRHCRRLLHLGDSCNRKGSDPMISRRVVLTGIGAAALLTCGRVFAAEEQPFTPQAFQAAQDQHKPILVEIDASWCPVCRAQKPILSELFAQPKFKDLTVLRVDFDSQKKEVRSFGAKMQSTLIVFKGGEEVGRSVGQTEANAIAALLNKAI
jgi:thioredoxin 1